MARRRDPWKEEAQRRALEKEREKDTIYYLDFDPLDGRPKNRSTLLNDPWCVELPRNPEGHPEDIENAIKAFEVKHAVESWSEVALRYRVSSLYYP